MIFVVLDEDLLELRNSKGNHAPLLSEMCKFYRDWHVKSDGFHGIWKYILLLYAFANYRQIWEETHFWQKIAICSGIFLHDPVSFTAVLHPEYFTFKKGVVRVETQGICTGHTLMDQGLKKYALFWVTHKRLTHLLFVSFHILTYTLMT